MSDGIIVIFICIAIFCIARGCWVCIREDECKEEPRINDGDFRRSRTFQLSESVSLDSSEASEVESPKPSVPAYIPMPMPHSSNISYGFTVSGPQMPSPYPPINPECPYPPQCPNPVQFTPYPPTNSNLQSAPYKSTDDPPPPGNLGYPPPNYNEAIRMCPELQK